VRRFEDTNGDGVADKREVVLTGWPLHSNGTALHGPYLGPTQHFRVNGENHVHLADHCNGEVRLIEAA
jgi:hypothetical protein